MFSIYLHWRSRNISWRFMAIFMNCCCLLFEILRSTSYCMCATLILAATNFRIVLSCWSEFIPTSVNCCRHCCLLKGPCIPMMRFCCFTTYCKNAIQISWSVELHLHIFPSVRLQERIRGIICQCLRLQSCICAWVCYPQSDYLVVGSM